MMKVGSTCGRAGAIPWSSWPRGVHCNMVASSLPISPPPPPLPVHGEAIPALQGSLDRIRKAGVIACVRSHSAELAVAMGRAALDGGVHVLEITMNSNGAVEVINKLQEEYPCCLIGAGTVLSSGEAEFAINAGAKFLMSPAALKDLVEMHKHGPTLFIPGTMTPTEVLNAYNLGAHVVKLYPVALLGGAKFVQALKKPFNHIPLIASHGITLDMVELYMAAGAMAVVLSDAIFSKESIANKDFKQMRQRAKIAAETGSASFLKFSTKK